MSKLTVLIYLACLLIVGGCSGENDSVRASDAKDIMNKVESDVEDAAEDAAARLEDALEQSR